MKPIVAVIGLLCIACGVFAQDAPQQFLFTNVNVWDGKAEQLLMETDVLVEGQLIAQVGRDIVAPGATVIDGGGRIIMPGLIDMHSHFAIQEGMLTGRSDYDQMAMGARAAKDMRGYLDQGFTTARDAGGNISRTADRLGRSRSAVYRMIDRHGITLERKASS